MIDQSSQMFYAQVHPAVLLKNIQIQIHTNTNMYKYIYIIQIQIQIKAHKSDQGQISTIIRISRPQTITQVATTLFAAKVPCLSQRTIQKFSFFYIALLPFGNISSLIGRQKMETNSLVFRKMVVLAFVICHDKRNFKFVHLN